MFDPWAQWDTQLRATSGRPARLAQELTAAELLTLLASERRGERDPEKRIVKNELLSRLEASRPSPASARVAEGARRVVLKEDVDGSGS